MAQDSEKQLKSVNADLDKLQKGLGQLETMFKKKRGEFDTLLHALWEGKKEIEQQRKAVKDMGVTFVKITAKIQTIRKTLIDQGGVGANLQRSINDLDKKVAVAEKAITKEKVRDKSELTRKLEAVKTIRKRIGQQSNRASDTIDEAEGLPNLPKL
jgi:chromosome segregation ATPase